ncbi:MAG: hypothetical protein NVS4B10_23000 [Myxococcales bacterium]
MQRAFRRAPAAALASALASSVTAGCAHAPPPPAAAQPQVHVLGEAGLVPPRRVEASCPPAPPSPHEAEAKHLSGVARLTFIVRADGTVDSIQPDPAAATLFAEAAKAWLSSCRFEAGTLAGDAVDVLIQKVVGFRNLPRPPPALGEEPPPLEPLDVPVGVAPPYPIGCAPTAAPWGGQYPAEIEFIVHRDGRVGEVSVRPGPVEIPPADLELLRAWLDTCPFVPASYQDKPVPVRAKIVNRFPRDYPWDVAVKAMRNRGANAPLLSPDLTPPAPVDCKKPTMPELARQAGLAGLVVVEYVIESNGRVTRVALLNPGTPWILFQAVDDWLIGCRFTPAKTLDGRAVPVRVIQPFNFKFVS